MLVIGHVTKFGEVAGPKTLENLVDVVLYLEGDQHHGFRILRGAKNRFGSTSEVGVFEMATEGLKEIKDPSSVFLTDAAPSAGTVVTAALEGSRIFFLEVQALVSQTNFGYPQRKSHGFDLNRLQLLVATLTRRLGLKLGNQDIYLNVVGGLKISEPAVDLAVCLAIMSAYKNKAVPRLVAFGEVGLTGEVRPVSQQDRRIAEAVQRGFARLIVPQTSSKTKLPTGCIAVKSIKEALSSLGD
jgi:DNA repair protein RadA/Sms